MPAETNFYKTLAQLDGDLGEGAVHVWLANAEVLRNAGQGRILPILNDEELRRADRFKVDSAREQFVASRGFLRIVVGRYLGIEPRRVEFRLTPHGKPLLPEGQGFFFNLSHTSGLTAIAVTRLGAIGIDVECVRRESNVLELAQRFFSKKEVAWLSAKSDEERVAGFLACWTAKEAYIKAEGEGMSIALDSFAIIPEPSQWRMRLEVFKDAARSNRWFLSRLEMPPGYWGALAVEAAQCEIHIGELTDSAY